MKPGTLWIGIVLLAVGVCGVLDAAGIVDSAQTIGLWWPVAIIGWALTAMAGERRVTFAGVVCAAVGLALLADVQAWTTDVLVWSGLAIALGIAVVAAAFRRREGHGVPPVVGGGAS